MKKGSSRELKRRISFVVNTLHCSTIMITMLLLLLHELFCFRRGGRECPCSGDPYGENGNIGRKVRTRTPQPNRSSRAAKDRRATGRERYTTVHGTPRSLVPCNQSTVDHRQRHSISVLNVIRVHYSSAPSSSRPCTHITRVPFPSSVRLLFTPKFARTSGNRSPSATTHLSVRDRDTIFQHFCP